jgi:ring-1,2-phenylacetyl-CoA epoxidase subunit PaaD
MKAAATAIAAAAPAVRSAADAARNAGAARSTTDAPGRAAVAPEQAGASVEQIWAWLGEVPDPEIPVISIVDLGIVRNVSVAADGACEITITPTYSGCPAMQVIADAITDALHAHGVAQVRLHNQISPAWTTDWMSDAGKAALKGYGIAPPAQQVIDISGLRGTVGAAAQRSADGAHADSAAAATTRRTVAAAAVARRAVAAPIVACPHCGSQHTEITSQFGSTPCKALYKCLDCREPFDYFKCH